MGYEITKSGLATVFVLGLFIGTLCAPGRPSELTEIPEGQSCLDVLTQFLAEDNTDNRDWSDSYNCVDFSADLSDRAVAAGFIAVPVRLRTSPDSAHQIVAFYLADATVVFVEPQSDRIVGIFDYPIYSAEVVF